MVSGYRGLAESFLEGFAAAGYQLSVLVRRTDAVLPLRDRYPSAVFVVGDTTDGETCRKWIDETWNRFGRIDCLVNNAAITGPGGLLHELPFEEVVETFRVNLLAPIQLCQLVLPRLVEQGQGVILNLSGGGATGPRPRFTPYAVSKCAVLRLTENIAREYPELRCYAIAPGALKTPMLEGVLKMDRQKIGAEYDEAHRRCREGAGEDPRRAAELAVWLCENRPVRLNGRLISAVWDNYREAPEYPDAVGWWTLRRVDEVCSKNLKSVSSAADSSAKED